MFEGFFQLGGTEIANSMRVADYVRKNLPQFPLSNCVDCDNLREALGDPLYESPLVDDAPWVDESNPATYDFYGFYPLEIQGVSQSTRQAAVTESINDGGYVGAVRYGTREIRVKGILVARNGLALEAGMTWLRMALDPSTCSDHDGSCGGAKMCFYAACPTIDLQCFRPTAVDGPIENITSITAETSPTLFNLPDDPGSYQAFFRVNPTDGLVFNWGRRKLLSDEVIQEFGPAVSQRTNFITNPSFTLNSTGWTTSVGMDGTWHETGGADGGGYLALGEVENLTTNPSFESVTPGTVAMRINLSKRPQASSGWTSSAGTGGLITGSLVEDARFPGGFARQTLWTKSPTANTSLTINPNQVPAVTNGKPHVVRFAYAVTDWPGFQPAITVNTVPVSPLTITDLGDGLFEAWGVIAPNASAPAVLLGSAGTLPPVGATLRGGGQFVEAGSTYTGYFDGSTPAADGWVYAWSGAANTAITQARSAEVVTTRNLYGNPSFESTSGTVELNRNLLTNPSFEAVTAGSFFATRSNYFLRPNLVSTDGIIPDGFTNETGAGITGTMATTGGTWRASNVAIPASNGGPFTARLVSGTGFLTGATAASPITVSADVSGIAGTNVSAGLVVSFFDVTGPVGTATALATANGRISATVTTFTRPPDRYTAYLMLRATVNTTAVTGGAATIANPIIEFATADRGSFSGSTAAAGDYTYAWAGTANESVSQQRGAVVAQYASNTPAATPYSSTEWKNSRTRSLRITPTSITGANDSFAMVDGGAGALRNGMVPGKTYTAVATVRLAAPQTGTLAAFARGIRVWTKTAAGSPVSVDSTMAPNVAGTAEVRITFTVPAAATEAYIYLYNGAGPGGGDVWFDNFLLTEARSLTEPYTGPYFDGTTAAEVDFSYAWVSTADASASIRRSTGVAASATGAGRNAISSREWTKVGTRSIRIIPTVVAPNPAAGVTVTMPAPGIEVGKTYTATATYRATAASGDTTNGLRQLYYMHADGSRDSATAPDGPGETELRITFTRMAGDTETSIHLGGNGPSSDGWWDALLITEVPSPAAPYTGSYFDGNTFSENSLRYAWTGTANASVATESRPAIAGASMATGTGTVWQDIVDPADGYRFARYRIGTLGDVVLGVTDAAVVPAGEAQSATLEVRVNPTTSGLALPVQPIWRDPSGAYELAGDPVPITPGTGWVTISRTGASTLADAQLSLLLPAGAGHQFNDTIDIDLHTVYPAEGGELVSDPVTAGAGAVVASYALRGAGTTVTVELRTADTDDILQTATYTVTNTWQRYGLTSTIGRALYLRITAEAPYDLDQVIVENASVAMPYFDGGSDANTVMAAYRPKGTEYTAAWLGTPDLSASRIVWQAESITSSGMQQFGLDEECDPLWRPYLSVVSGEIRNGQFGYHVREMVPIEEQVETYERHYHDVTAIEGPTIIEKFQESRLGGAAYVVDFTMVAATPFAYSTSREIVPLPELGMPHSHLPSELWVDQSCAEPDAGPILDPDCPVPPIPPGPPPVENPCIDNPALWQRSWLEIPADEVSAWSQMVPKVVLSTQAQDVRQVRVRFYPNPFGYDSVTTSRQNSAPNPVLQLDSAGWTHVAGSSVRVAAGGPDNRAYWETTATAAHAAQGFGPSSGLAPAYNLVVPGQKLWLSMYAKTSAARGVQLRWAFLDAAGAVIGAVAYGPAVAKTAGTWTRVGNPAAVVVPAGAVRISLGVVNTTVAVIGEKIAATMSMIEPSDALAPGEYFDGNMINANGWYYGFAGDSNLSASVAATSPIDPCSYCSEFIVSYVPPYSVVTVDGMVRRAYASVQGGPTRPASNLLYAGDGGPMSWTELTCGIPYLVSVDVPPDEHENVEFGLELTRKE